MPASRHRPAPVASVCVLLHCRKAGPINHGPCTEGQLLEATAQVVREKFIERANSIQFSLIALAAAGGN